MKRSESDQARSIIGSVEEVVRQRRAGDDAEPLSAQNLERERLSDLVRCLSTVEAIEPQGFRAELAKQILASGQQQAPGAQGRRSGSWRPALTQSMRERVGPRAAMVMAAVLVGLVVTSQSLMHLPVVSAETVLSRSDAALTGLVGPGQVLYRKWRVTSDGAAGAMTGAGRSQRIIEEWMDGGDTERVAGRWYSNAGALQVAYTTRWQGGDWRPYVYFSPGTFGERRGVLNIEPTRQEFDTAAVGFPESVRRALRVYLDRHYIYAPISGERSFNKAIFSAADENVPEMPRILVSFDQSYVLNGTPVYRVRLLDSASITFNWRSVGPPLIRLAQAEIVRYVARDSFLSVRTEASHVFEDGRRRSSTRELMATKVLELAGLADDPFAIDVPPDVPVQRQSALEHLLGVADVLRRVPAFTSRLGLEPGVVTHQPH